MNNIYTETLEKVGNGARFNVNLENRSLKLNGKYVIKDGKYEGVLGVEPQSIEEVLKEIERLYRRYHNSVPSERSDGKRKIYFKALAEHELSDADMLYGEHRDIAQIALELYVLCSILNGSLVWDSFAAGLWFWKSPNENGLIILKDWITPKNHTNNN